MKRVNYIFFLLLFILLNSFSFFHLNQIENHKLLFLFQNFSLSFLEVLIFIYISSMIKTTLKGLLLIIFFLQFIHFFMINLMDSSIFYIFSLLFENGLKGIFITIKACNFSSLLLFLIILFPIILPCASSLFYIFLQKISNKKPFDLPKKSFFYLLFSLITICTGLHLFSKNFPKNYQKRLLISIPSKKTSFIFKKNLFSKKQLSLSPPKNISKNPNIFLFILESFRKDLIDEKITPNLYQFKKENISFKTSLANSNCTNLSWFSLFYATLPYDWTSYKNNPSGAPPLKILKNINYTINVLSSSDLKYFDMDKIIFGNNLQLIDNFTEFKDPKPFLRDKKNFETLKKNIKKKNNLYISFLESTHSEYSYPKNFSKFTPAAPCINYFSLAFLKKNIYLLKNRYLNTAYYIDSLFKDFFDYLKQKNLYKDAIIIILADHGEEFFEKGSLFHGTHLNEYQLKIPILYKIPGRTTKKTSSSTIDVFPTILDILTTKKYSFDGNSILSKKDSPIFSFCQEGGKNPKKFVIHTEDKKILLYIKNKDTFEILQN